MCTPCRTNFDRKGARGLAMKAETYGEASATFKRNSGEPSDDEVLAAPKGSQQVTSTTGTLLGLLRLQLAQPAVVGEAPTRDR